MFGQKVKDLAKELKELRSEVAKLKKKSVVVTEVKSSAVGGNVL